MLRQKKLLLKTSSENRFKYQLYNYNVKEHLNRTIDSELIKSGFEKKPAHTTHVVCFTSIYSTPKEFYLH